MGLACGTQGPPLPPRVQIPETVTDLKADQLGHKVELSWTLPLFATDQERLTRPLEIEVFRHFVRPGKPAPNPIPATTPWVTLVSSDVRPLAVNGVIRIEDSFDAEGLARGVEGLYLYTVRSVTRAFGGRRRESALSNVADLRIFPVSRPVSDLQAESTEQAVRLAWTHPSALSEPSRYFRGFNVYRSQGDEESAFRLLAKVARPHYEDREFELGREFRYKVRVVFGDEEYAGESEDSNLVSLTPRDVFPPRPPQGLAGLYAGNATELLWKPNTELDLAGYHVYRRQSPASFQRLNQRILPTPIYRDTSVEPGQSYQYGVTAVDLQGNESLYSETVAVAAQ